MRPTPHDAPPLDFVLLRGRGKTFHYSSDRFSPICGVWYCNFRIVECPDPNVFPDAKLCAACRSIAIRSIRHEAVVNLPDRIVEALRIRPRTVAWLASNLDVPQYEVRRKLHRLQSAAAVEKIDQRRSMRSVWKIRERFSPKLTGEECFGSPPEPTCQACGRQRPALVDGECVDCRH